MHAIAPGHHERRLRPFGHLVADEDVTEELFLGGLGVGYQFRQYWRGGHGISGGGNG
jgi:hypothetical protein